MLRTHVFSILLAAICVSVAAAQPGPRQPGPSRPAGSARAGSSRGQLANFARKAPQVGDTLPDVTLLKADGSPLNLRELRGHYSVITFGCLT